MSVVRIKRHDTRPFDAVLTANQQPVNLTGAVVRFIMVPKFAGGTTVGGVCAFLNAAKGQVRYVWQVTDLATPGLYDAEFEVTFGDGTVETFPNGEYIAVQVLADLG